ncbi:tetratricopeptide repeat protein 16 isoform X3 [Anas platyrhynchos]|uniref:tetratricopeptide repeat protein 16 isoform X3 n=1 Tax=Anas platyrhynchos TaxID=8839 RepID=UPI003AF1EB39
MGAAILLPGTAAIVVAGGGRHRGAGLGSSVLPPPLPWGYGGTLPCPFSLPPSSQLWPWLGCPPGCWLWGGDAQEGLWGRGGLQGAVCCCRGARRWLLRSCLRRQCLRSSWRPAGRGLCRGSLGPAAACAASSAPGKWGPSAWLCRAGCGSSKCWGCSASKHGHSWGTRYPLPALTAFSSTLRGQEHTGWQKGLEFSSCGQWEEAIICYTKAIGLDPQRVAELYEQRAEAFLQLCDFQSAALNFRKVLALGPAREQHCLARLALVLDLQGRCLLDQELYSEALEAFTRAAELQPHRRVFRRRSILCLAALNKFPECLRMLNRDLAEDVRNPDLYVLRASFYEHFGQDIQRALELDPQHGAAQALRQRLQRRGLEAKAEAASKALCGDLRGALLRISFAIETNPSAAEFFTLRGALLRRLKDFGAALKDLAKARQLCADEGPEAQEARRQLVLTYNDRAVHCYARGQLNEAVMLLGEALRDERTEEGLYVNRGDCFLRLGELAHALADYQQALELSPGNLGVQRRVAAALHELGRRDVAARWYQQAEARFSATIEHDPQEALHHLRLCPQKVQSTREDTLQSLRLDPTDSEILSLTHHLFPRTTVQPILRSETGRLTQETLEKTLQSPPEPTILADDTWCDSSRFPRKWRPQEAQQSWPSQSLRGLTSRKT